MAVSWDSTSIPRPVVMDSARERRLSNSLGSMSVSSVPSSLVVESGDVCSWSEMPLSGDRSGVLSSTCCWLCEPPS